MSDIVLTPTEVQFLLNELAVRDPIMRLLLEKQARAAQPQPQGDLDPRPMRVAGGTAA